MSLRKNSIATNVVQETMDYDKFSFLSANRDQSRGHIEMLKSAFEVIGNLTAVQPILVNQKFQIIDGQHRFTACKELEQPIYYTMVSGLGVNEARSMNILHRGWTVDDYAKSYAETGNVNYQKYLGLREDYGFSHTVTLAYITQDDNRGLILKDFRTGDFVLEDEDGAVDRLEYLTLATEKAPVIGYRPMSLAFLKVMQSETFDRERMLKKLENYGNKLERFEKVEPNIRQLEDIYNHNVAAGNRVRLY